MRKIQINDLRKGMFKAKRSSAPVELRDSSKEKSKKQSKIKDIKDNDDNRENKSKTKKNKYGLIEAAPFLIDYSIVERKRLKNYFKRLKMKIIDELFSGEHVVDTNMIYRNEEAIRVYKYAMEDDTYSNENNSKMTNNNDNYNYNYNIDSKNNNRYEGKKNISKIRDRRIPPESKFYYNKNVSKYNKYYNKGNNDNKYGNIY